VTNETAFVTLDSGERTVFGSGMQRDTTKGKPNPSLVLDGPMFQRWVDLMTRGAEKYDERNWMKASGPAELERFKQSAFRHFIQWLNGETDEDHAAAVIFNLNGAEYVLERIVRDWEPGYAKPGAMTESEPAEPWDDEDWTEPHWIPEVGERVYVDTPVPEQGDPVNGHGEFGVVVRVQEPHTLEEKTFPYAVKLDRGPVVSYAPYELVPAPLPTQCGPRGCCGDPGDCVSSGRA